MKILMTGGHVTPALAIIDELLAMKDQNEIIFVGREYALGSEKIISFESKEIRKKNIRFIDLKAGRFSRLISLRTIYNLLKIPIGFIRAWQIVGRENPDIIISFGGYIGLPVVLSGYLKHKKIYIHEQTICPGIANRLSGIFAKKVFCAFNEAYKYFPANKTIITGNPLRRTIRPVTRNDSKIKKDRPVIYVTGGSLGSHSINMHIKEILKELLKKYIIIHQVGETKEYNDFAKLENFRRSLPPVTRKKYLLNKHFFEDEIGHIYSLADLVVGRAGANTFFELVALEKPAIFIPLPWSANQEQQKQAEIFRKYRVGAVFNQSGSSRELLKLIENTMDNIDFYRKNFPQLHFLYRYDATKVIIKEIFCR